MGFHDIWIDPRVVTLLRCCFFTSCNDGDVYEIFGIFNSKYVQTFVNVAAFSEYCLVI